MANYPLSIKRFVARKNLTDTVRAEHMNEAQDEIEAIQSVLGLNPHQDDRSIDSAWSWGTVKERLEYMIRGRHIPAIALYNGATYTRNSDSYSAVTFAAPIAANDTHGGFSANMYKIPRDGWYFFVGSCYFNPTTLKGNRQLRLYTAAGTNLGFSDRDYYGETRATGDWMQVVAFTRFTKGAQVGMSANIVTGGYTNGKYSTKYHGLRGHLVRGA